MTPAAHALVVLAGALALDAIAGEPPDALHPVVWMGRFYATLRRRAPRSPAAAFAYGCLMALAGPLVFGAGGLVIGRLLAPLPLLRIVVEIYLLKSALSVRMLGEAATAVARALDAGDYTRARSRSTSSPASRPTRCTRWSGSATSTRRCAGARRGHRRRRSRGAA